MKKLFISCPMKDRTEGAILHDMDRMHKMAEIIFDQELEPIRSYIPGAVRGCPEGVNPSVYCLGDAIKLMAEADYFIGVDCISFSNGCYVENAVAARYDIPSTFVHAREFMPDMWKKEEESWAISALPTNCL